MSWTSLCETVGNTEDKLYCFWWRSAYHHDQIGRVRLRVWAGQNGVKVMLKRAYSSYQRTEWFKITPKLLDPWICNLLMVQLNSTHLLPLVSGKLEAQKLNHLKAPSHMPSGCCWVSFGYIGFFSWGPLMLSHFMGFFGSKHSAQMLPQSEHLLKSEPSRSCVLFIT